MWGGHSHRRRVHQKRIHQRRGFAPAALVLLLAGVPGCGATKAQNESATSSDTVTGGEATATAADAASASSGGAASNVADGNSSSTGAAGGLGSDGSDVSAVSNTSAGAAANSSGGVSGSEAASSSGSVGSETASSSAGGSGGCPVPPLEAVSEAALAETLAQSLCARFFECECSDALERYASEAACVSERTQEVAMLQSQAESAGDSYQAACAAEFIRYRNSVGCAQTSPCLAAPNCAVYAGAGSANTACAANGFLDSCQPGYRCTFQQGNVGSVCTAIPEPSNLAPGDACGPPYDCGPLAYCSGADGMCIAYGTPGDACGTGLPPCLSSAYCNSATAECTPRPGAGEACSTAVPCAPDFVCPVGGATCVASGEPPVCAALF